MKEITIVLTAQELDFVCNVLADRPFKEVNGLLAKIVNQANAPALPVEVPLPEVEPPLKGESNG